MNFTKAYAAAAALAAAGFCHAAGDDPAGAPAAIAEEGSSDASEAAGILESLESTAYRFGSDPLSVPVNSTLISRERIGQSGANSISEVLQKEGNVRFMSFTGNNSQGNVAMRGFGENSQLRVLVLVDGQRYNRVDMDSINWLQVPLANVESIEVLRGSQSAMYGNNAVAGVIKITTRKSEEKNTLRVGGVYGSYNFYNVDASFSGREGDWFYNAALNRYGEKGYRENSAAWAESASASVGYDFSADTSLTLSGNYSKSYTEFPTGLTWEQFQNNPKQGALSQTYAYNAGVYTASLESSSSIGRGAADFGVNFRDRDLEDGTWKKNDQWTFTFSPRYEIDSLENLKISAGIDADYTSISFNQRIMRNGGVHTLQYADVQRFDIGPYAGAEYEISEGLTFSAAGRAEASRTAVDNVRYRITSVGRPTPPVPDPNSTYDDDTWQAGLAANAGLNWKLSEHSSVYARFDQIYRYPSTDEIAFYQGMSQAGGFPFNANLDPEHGQNYEIGYKYSDENWTANANFFVLYLNNEIMYDYTENLNINADPTLRYGVDLELRYDSKYWGASAGGSFVKAEFCSGSFDGSAVPLVPEFSGTASVYVKPMPWLRLSVRGTFFDSQFQGNDFSNSRRNIPSYALMDLQANIRFCEYASMYVACENVTDENYAAFAYGGLFYPNAGRTFKVGLNLKY